MIKQVGADAPGVFAVEAGGVAADLIMEPEDKAIPGMLDRPDVALSFRLKGISIRELNARLTNPFPVASCRSKVSDTKNVLVVMESQDGVVGLGEAAPFAGISGDSQEVLMTDIASVTALMSGATLSVFELEALARKKLKFPAARAALEMAFFDIAARTRNEKLVDFLNPKKGYDGAAFTDITIPIVSGKMAAFFARQYFREGFRRIKIKVGDSVGRAAARVEAVWNVFQDELFRGTLEILIDANEGYSARDAIRLLRELKTRNIEIRIFEQPVARGNLKGMREVKEEAGANGISVLADEAIYGIADMKRFLKNRAIDGVVLKLMKFGGIIETVRVAKLALDSGLGVIMGGMVETRLAMTAALHVAMAINNVFWLDLDTPRLLAEDTFTGGLNYAQHFVSLPNGPGIGVGLAEH